MIGLEKDDFFSFLRAPFAREREAAGDCAPGDSLVGFA